MIQKLKLSDQDAAALKKSLVLLEGNSLVRMMTDLTGKPIEEALRKIPKPIRSKITGISEITIKKSLHLAIISLNHNKNKFSLTDISTVLAAGFGGVSGLLGPATLALELPLTTTLILREIANVASSYGESLEDNDTRIACIEVFALARHGGANNSHMGYYASRAVFARLAGNSASFLTERGLINSSAPLTSGFIAELASRYGLVLSEKIAVSTIPIIGAIGGAAINVLFIRYFKHIAEGHFTLRKLERKYGSEIIRIEYCKLHNENKQLR